MERTAVVHNLRAQLLADMRVLRLLIEAEASRASIAPPRFVLSSFHNRDLTASHGFFERGDVFPHYINQATQKEIRNVFVDALHVDGADTRPAAVGYKGYYPSEQHHTEFASRLLKAIRLSGFVPQLGANKGCMSRKYDVS